MLDLLCKLIAWLNLFRPRFYISVDHPDCRQKVQYFSNGTRIGDGVCIRLKIENFGWGQNPHPVDVYLNQITHNDQVVENDPSKLEWTHNGTFSSQPVWPYALVNVCHVVQSNTPVLEIDSEKGRKGFSFRDSGIYKFTVRTVSKGSSTGKATLTVSFYNGNWENLHIVNVLSRPKHIRWFL